MSRKIELQGLNNTRDLGGMRGADGGRIISGKLIRSGHLHDATAADLEYLSGNVCLVVDLRTKPEIEEKPDPFIENVENLCLPVLERLAAGVSREAESDKAAFAMVASDPELAEQYMLRTYSSLITSDYSISQYRRFVQLLFHKREKAVLWHCTAGKDRAGLATVIVQELLGVDRSDIYEDYLKTNEYLSEEISRICKMISLQIGSEDEKTEKALRCLFGVEKQYLDTVYRKIEEVYGGFKGFLTKGLYLEEADCDALRNTYLC